MIRNGETYNQFDVHQIHPYSNLSNLSEKSDFVFLLMNQRFRHFFNSGEQQHCPPWQANPALQQGRETQAHRIVSNSPRPLS